MALLEEPALYELVQIYIVFDFLYLYMSKVKGMNQN